MDPAVRADFMAFLHEQASQDSNIILLEASALPPQDQSGYINLSHASGSARARFSQYMADVLEKLTQAKSPESQDHVGMSQN